MPKPNARPVARLYCLPHAGGGSSTFGQWPAVFGAKNIETLIVEYPGRETRSGEPAIADARQLVDELNAAWPEYNDGVPYAVYGHSMGAMLAFEIVAKREQRGQSLPCLVGLGARSAPSLRLNLNDLHSLADDDFVAEINRRYNSIPPEIIEEPSALEYWLPILRADFRLVETYSGKDSTIVSTPLLVFGGDHDSHVSIPDLSAWKRHTAADLQIHIIVGDHFFHRTQVQQIADPLAATIQIKIQKPGLGRPGRGTPMYA